MKKVGGFIATAFAVKEVVSFTKAAVNAASETQAAWTGLNSIVNGTGNSFKVAQDFITEYTRDGLVSVNEAVTAYKNLLSRGYNTTQIEDTMNALKDSASFGRQASYGLGEAVATATEGLKNENSILVDNAGVTKNVAKMWDEYAKSIGKTSNNLTQAEKIQAEYNGIMKETKFQTGDAIAYTNTFSGQVQRLKALFTSLKVAVGKVVIPVAQLFIPVINSTVTALTNLFNGISKVLSAFGLKFNEVVSKSSGNISSIGDSASNSASEAVSAAKKINKAFAGVDEIQVVSPNKSNSSTKDDTNNGNGIGQFKNISSEVIETEGAFDKLTIKFKKLKDLFMNGFEIGFNDTNFSNIAKSLEGIKQTVTEIFDSETVKKSIKKWGKSVTINLGRITGSISRTGTNIVENLVGSIETYTKQNKSKIEDYFSSMFDINTETFNIAGRLFETIAGILEVFKSEEAIQIGSNIISMFSNPFMSVTEILSKFKNDFLDLIVTPITENSEKIKTAIENTLIPIQSITDTLSGAFTYMGDTIGKVYDEHMAPFFESLKTGLSDTFSKFLDVYNKYVVPFIERMTEKFKILWDEHLKPLWDNISKLIGSVVDLIKVLWEKYLKPTIDWCIQNILPKLIPIFERIGSMFMDIFGTISAIIGGLIKTLRGLIEFIVGVFTSDWDRAWNGVKDIFGGIFDALKSLFKLPINWIIDGINKFIDGINNVKIPDWVPVVGGKGFNIGHISRLATGGYVEKNNPQLAIVGDNTREGEIITPESKIAEQVRKGIESANNTGKQELSMTIYVKYEDGKTIIKKVNQAQIDAGEILLLM